MMTLSEAKAIYKTGGGGSSAPAPPDILRDRRL